MVGWHHRLDGHELEQALGIGDGQGSLALCHSWGRKESDTTERLSRSDAWKFVSFGQHLPMFPTHLLVATIILSVFVSLTFSDSTCK